MQAGITISTSLPSATGMAKASNCEIRSSQGSRGSCYCGLDMTSFVGGFGFRIPEYTVSQPRKRYVLMYVIFFIVMSLAKPIGSLTFRPLMSTIVDVPHR